MLYLRNHTHKPKLVKEYGCPNARTDCGEESTKT